MEDKEILEGAARLAPWGHTYEVRPGFWIGEPKGPDWRVSRFKEKLEKYGIDITKARVLDLACLDGRFCIEFGREGAETVGVDMRPDNIARARFAAQALDINNASFIESNVVALDPDVIGKFDVILCCGLLYHLTAEDALKLIGIMKRCCRGAVIIETHISLPDRVVEPYPLGELIECKLEGRTFQGRIYQEFPPETSMENRMKLTASSVENDQSFWFTDGSLTEAIESSGLRLVERFHARDGMDLLALGRFAYLALV